MGSEISRSVLDAQNPHWARSFAERPTMFGEAPSEPATKALALFRTKGLRSILELGAGQGRDTLLFAAAGLEVTALDYVEEGLGAIVRKAEADGYPGRIAPVCHDVRQPLPFPDASFDGCYSHMLYCMALTTGELEALSAEVLRVLRPGGLQIYTVRHTGDAHYGAGIHRGEDMYEVGGYIVHFFSPEKVQRLAAGYEVLAVEKFEEGGLPRKLFQVTLRKPERTRLAVDGVAKG